MAIELREILGYKLEESTKYKCNQSSLQENEKKTFRESYLEHHRDDFIVNIEAMHCAPHATGNNTRYMAEACKASIKEWSAPYVKPLILYHNDYDGTMVGRILEANVSTSSKTNTECLNLKATVPLWEHQRQVEAGLYLTTSIGVSGTDVRCSICGQQLAGGDFCEHIRGNTYDGKLCTWDVYAFTPKECSFVINPSDIYSGITSITRPNEDGMPETKHISLTNKESQQPNGADDFSLQEGQQQPMGNQPNKENNENTMALDENKYNEAMKLVESLQTSEKTLQNDKLALNEQINVLNKEKLEMQESMKALKADLANKETELANANQLREQLEKDREEMLKEVKISLVETLTNLREQAGRPKVDKLDERDIQSLRYAISDIRAEIEAQKLTESKNSVQDTSISDPEPLPGANAGTENKASKQENKSDSSSFMGL